jgi:hypothetical protein
MQRRLSEGKRVKFLCCSPCAHPIIISVSENVANKRKLLGVSFMALYFCYFRCFFARSSLSQPIKCGGTVDCKISLCQPIWPLITLTILYIFVFSLPWPPRFAGLAVRTALVHMVVLEKQQKPLRLPLYQHQQVAGWILFVGSQRVPRWLLLLQNPPSAKQLACGDRQPTPREGSLGRFSVNALSSGFLSSRLRAWKYLQPRSRALVYFSNAYCACAHWSEEENMFGDTKSAGPLFLTLVEFFLLSGLKKCLYYIILLSSTATIILGLVLSLLFYKSLRLLAHN